MKFPLLLKGQITEEWRIHSSFVGARSFSLFPLGVFLLSSLMFFLFSSFRLVISEGTFLGILSFLFFFLGVSVGSFGTIGKEVLNRRFGQASLLSYSSRILPVGERELFLSFVAKDIIYYSALWIAPIAGGIFLSSIAFGRLFFVPVPFTLFALLFGAFTLFLFGASLTFLASSAFSRRPLLGALSGALICGGLAGKPDLVFSIGLEESAWRGALSLAAIVPALFLFREDYSGEELRASRAKKGFLSGRFPGRLGLIVEKDFSDISRSGGGFARVVFSIIIPLAVLFFALEKLGEIIPEFLGAGIFPIFLGIVLASAYSWFTDTDSPSNYSFLPLRRRELLLSKALGTSGISVPLAVLGSALTAGSLQAFALGLFVSLGVFFHSLASTILVSGTNPSIRLYSFGEFWKYSALIGVPGAVLAFLAISREGGYFFLVVGALFFSGGILLTLALNKWGRGEFPGENEVF